MNRDVCEHFNPVDLPCGKCKPEALRLADWLEDQYDPTYNQAQAAAELRRLYAKCEALTEDTTEEMRRITELYRVTAQRDALLEALKTVEWHGQGSCWVVDADKIAAAIKAAEENTP